MSNPIPPRDSETPTKVYAGGCHCGKFAFECRHPILEDGFEVVSCNCSICTQRGTLSIYIMDPEKDLKLVKGAREDLTEYTFNKGVVTQMFCPVCGCTLFGKARTVFGVNVRAIAGLDLDRLTIKKFDGRAI